MKTTIQRLAESTHARTALLASAAALMLAAIWLPLWGMTLASIQYPEGLRMVIYPTRIQGDITEINVLNHYIGMREISNEFFPELQVIPSLFTLIARATLGAIAVRKLWATAMPLLLMAGTAAYGFWSMRHRLYQFGHDLDPRAPIDIEPFTPPMFGEHTLAQFGTYAYFSWGSILPAVAGVLVALALWRDLRGRNIRITRQSVAALFLVGVAGCSQAAPDTQSANAASSPSVKTETPGDREYAALTTSWSPAALETCGGSLREALGTRDLVQGAIEGIAAPNAQAEAELTQARDYKAQGDRAVADLRPKLEAGGCDEQVQLALNEAVQAYIKAGTAAVQAGRITGQ